MRRELRALGLLLVVVIAGCSSLAGGTDRPVASVTPVDVPADSSITTSDGQPAFVRANGSFRDPADMAAAHRSVLQDTSYTVFSTQTVQFASSGRSGRWQLAARIAPRGAFTIETQRNGSVFSTVRPVRIGFWSNGDVVVEAFIANDTTTANIVRDARGNPVPPRTVMPIDPRFEGELTTVFASTTVRSITRLDDDADPYSRVRVRATGPAGSAAVGSLDIATTVSNLTAVLVIDERGLVHRYELRYTGTFATEPVTVTRTVRYAAIGQTSVPRPVWVEAALNGTAYDPSNGSNGSS